MNVNELSTHVKDPTRLAALRAVALLDTPTEEAFDRLSRLAVRFTGAPVALVTLVDSDRQFFKSCIGLPEPWCSRRQSPLSHSFCQHNRIIDKPLVIEDARMHPVFKDNPAVRELNVVAYLGIPLATKGGHVLGSFCVIDTKPRNWQRTEIEVINDLAAAVMTEIELRTEIGARGRVEGERDNLDSINKRLSDEITARKEAEKQQLQLEVQLHQSQKMQAIGRLAGGVAHDLNNLLTPILGYSELLKSDESFLAQKTKFLDEIYNSGLRARDLVRQLLAFSRKQTLEFKPLNLNTAIENFLRLLKRTIPEDIEIKVVLSPDVQLIVADVGQIEQVIMNLAVNAADAMPQGGELTIETDVVDLDVAYAGTHLDVSPGSHVMLAISDTGCGIEESIRDNIFEPFFSTKGKFGTGLGLSTVFGIIKQHGGNIWVYSEIDKGTTFKIYLPVAENVQLEEGVKERRITNLTGTETILLVEDDEPVRHLIYMLLEQQGYKVHLAKDSDEALNVLTVTDGAIDLLMTDIVLRGMTGVELYGMVAEKYPDLKVLYMSGYTDEVIAQRGGLSREGHFIQKPFSTRDLAYKIREALK